jgi:hypothetical protein
MTAPTAEGKYALCTEAQFDGHIQESRLCHAFTVAAPVAAPAPVAPVIPFVPEKSEVDAWLEAKIEFTDGGVFNPRYNSTFVPEQQKLVYEDRAHFAVLGTPGYVNSIRVETDPCKPAEPCVAPLREELYIAGATLEGKVVHASGTDTTVTKIQPRQELVAQYDGEDRNMRTHLVYQEQARNRGTDLSYVPRRIAGHSIINNEGNLFAVEAVLWGIVGTDRNHDGQITSDEQDCVPIAWKTQYVQIVPKGHEGAAFLGGVVVGLAGGYLLSAYGGPESSGDRPLSFPEFPLGTYTSGRQGNTVE